MFNKKKPLYTFKRHHCNGIQPWLAISSSVLDQIPVISLCTWHKNSFIQRLSNKVRELTGYHYANPIHGLYYYDGSRYVYPVQIQLEYKDFRNFYAPGKPDRNHKNVKGYLLSLFDPITGHSIFEAGENLKHWNGKMSKEMKQKIQAAMMKFHEDYLTPCAQSILNK
jgi:hypothetical protein